MDPRPQPTYTAFAGDRRLVTGPLAAMLRRTWRRLRDGDREPVLIFDDQTGRQVDFDFRGSADEVVLAILFSSLVENAIGPIVATMALIIIFMILSAFDVEILRDLKPYLFTSYMMNWRDFFEDPINFTEVMKSVFVLTSHIIVFFTATSFIFNKKDILS